MANGEWGSWEWHGTWGRGRYWADTGDGRGYMRHTITLRDCTKRDFNRKRAELQTLYDTGICRKAPTFSYLWELDVLPSLKESIAPNTLKNYLNAWTLHVCPKWGDRRVDAYNGAEVEAWLKSELPERTGKTCLTLMRKVSNRAYLLGITRLDPLAADIQVSTKSKRPKERTELDLAPYLAVAEADGPGMLAVFILVAGGGCRFGEALAVRADSVEWDAENGRATFRVDDQALPERSGLAGRLKNEQSARTASVPSRMGERLHRMACDALDRGDVYMCDRGGGVNVSEAAFRWRWKRALERAGLPNLTMRSLRRSFATLMLDAGADMGDVNLSMGHTRDSRVLFTNYDRPDASKAPILPAQGIFGDTKD